MCPMYYYDSETRYDDKNRTRNEIQEEYTKYGKEVTKSTRKDKGKVIEQLPSRSRVAADRITLEFFTFVAHVLPLAIS